MREFVLADTTRHPLLAHVRADRPPLVDEDSDGANPFG